MSFLWLTPPSFESPPGRVNPVYHIILTVKPGPAPDSVTDPAHVPALESPALTLEDWRGQHLPAASQVLVRRHHFRLPLLVRLLMHRLHWTDPVYLVPVRHVDRSRRCHAYAPPAATRRRLVVPAELVHDPRRSLRWVLERQGQPARVAALVAPRDSHRAPPPAAASAGWAWTPSTLEDVDVLLAVVPFRHVIDHRPDILLPELRHLGDVGAVTVSVAVAVQVSFAPAGGQLPALSHVVRGSVSGRRVDPTRAGTATTPLSLSDEAGTIYIGRQQMVEAPIYNLTSVAPRRAPEPREKIKSSFAFGFHFVCIYRIIGENGKTPTNELDLMSLYALNGIKEINYLRNMIFQIINIIRIKFTKFRELVWSGSVWSSGSGGWRNGKGPNGFSCYGGYSSGGQDRLEVTILGKILGPQYFDHFNFSTCDFLKYSAMQFRKIIS